ncbi:MAG: hypothetical protein KBC27_01320 [Rickettsiales bacterium]|nr:hypothetical protein [Rickettsiales bacterium]
MAITLYEEVREAIKARLYLLPSADLALSGSLYPLTFYVGKPALGNNDLQTLRTSLLSVDTTNFTSTTWRVLGDIFHVTDIGAISSVKLDGTSSYPIAQTIGYDPLETANKASLVNAINGIGDISTIKLDGSTAATSIAAAIGTGTLTTPVKTSLVGAINSLIDTSEFANINVATTDNFYGCSNGETLNAALDISRPTDTLESVLLKWVECAKFSLSTGPGYAPEGDGGTCLPLSSPGDAFAKCLGTIMTAVSYTVNSDES